jgi:hypothetical protein
MKVSDLKKLKFVVLTIETKIYLENSGRPVPNLNIVQEQKQYENKATFTRRFNKSVFLLCVRTDAITILFCVS